MMIWPTPWCRELSASENEAVQILHGHGEYTMDDYEADTQAVEDRLREMQSDLPLYTSASMSACRCTVAEAFGA